jgi:hypothetical protein
VDWAYLTAWGMRAGTVQFGFSDVSYLDSR